nr:hypothetical protein [Rhizobium leguminosarum]
MTGTDPAEEYRGTYRDREEAQEILRLFGGSLGLMEHQLALVGAVRVHQPTTGDIGLIRAMTGDTRDERIEAEIGAIRFGPLWACIHPAGVRATKAEFIAAWRLPA